MIEILYYLFLGAIGSALLPILLPVGIVIGIILLIIKLFKGEK